MPSRRETMTFSLSMTPFGNIFSYGQLIRCKNIFLLPKETAILVEVQDASRGHKTHGITSLANWCLKRNIKPVLVPKPESCTLIHDAEVLQDMLPGREGEVVTMADERRGIEDGTEILSSKVVMTDSLKNLIGMQIHDMDQLFFIQFWWAFFLLLRILLKYTAFEFTSKIL